MQERPPIASNYRRWKSPQQSRRLQNRDVETHLTNCVAYLAQCCRGLNSQIGNGEIEVGCCHATINSDDLTGDVT